MKSIVIFTTLLSVALFALVDGCRERVCTVDADCKWDECCLISLTGEKKICKDMGDDVGDVCGGAFFCSRCSRSLECVPLDKSILDEYNCTFPANGTCQLPQTNYSTVVISNSFVSHLNVSPIAQTEKLPVPIEKPTQP